MCPLNLHMQVRQEGMEVIAWNLGSWRFARKYSARFQGMHKQLHALEWSVSNGLFNLQAPGFQAALAVADAATIKVACMSQLFHTILERQMWLTLFPGTPKPDKTQVKNAPYSILISPMLRLFKLRISRP